MLNVYLKKAMSEFDSMVRVSDHWSIKRPHLNFNLFSL